MSRFLFADDSIEAFEMEDSDERYKDTGQVSDAPGYAECKEPRYKAATEKKPVEQKNPIDPIAELGRIRATLNARISYSELVDESQSRVFAKMDGIKYESKKGRVTGRDGVGIFVKVPDKKIITKYDAFDRIQIMFLNILAGYTLVLDKKEFDRLDEKYGHIDSRQVSR